MGLKPILFNTEMVQAILSGNKTETRRKVEVINGEEFACRYEVGDVLYVRETFKILPDGRIIYKANNNEDTYDNIPWTPSIHMPKKYSRIYLEVTKVYGQRLQDMTYEDLDAEGFYTGKHHSASEVIRAKRNFSEIWNSTLKKSELDTNGYDANPFVWVIRFKEDFLSVPPMNMYEDTKKVCATCVYVRYNIMECHDICDYKDSPYFWFHVNTEKDSTDTCDCWWDGKF